MIKYLLSIICVFFIVVDSNDATAQQTKQPVKWEFNATKVVDNVYALTFEANIDEGWYLYSQNIGEGGPIPTTFRFDENPNIELLSRVQESGDPKKGFDQLFEMDIIKYAKKVNFVALIKVKDPTTTLKGFVKSMSCNAMSCLPPKEVSFELDFLRL